MNEVGRVVEKVEVESLKPETRIIKSPCYIIVEAVPRDGYGRIDRYLREGYTLVGGPFVKDGGVYQAMLGTTIERMKIDYVQ